MVICPISCNVNFDYLVQVVLVKFLHCKIAFFSL